MAASSPPRKRKDRLTEADTRNRAGLGWKLEDFGTVVGGGFEVPGTLQYQGLQGTTFGQQNALPTTQLTRQLPPDTPIQNILSPAEIQRVQKFVKNPQEMGLVSGAVNSTATFLSNLFNVDDEKENLVETAWDGMLKALTWPNDQVNHLSAALISAAPGGMRTLSWDEAQRVSTGQALITDQGTRAGRIRRGEGNAIVEALGMGSLTALGAFNNPDSPVQRPDFDVTTPEGKAAFDSGYEKFFSGLTDFGMAFADPLLVAGWASKVARVKFVDRLIVSDAQRVKLVEDIKTGYTAPPGQAAPVAETLKRIMEVNPETGEKVLSYDDVFNMPFVQRSSRRAELARALHDARDTIIEDVLDPNKSTAISGYDLGGLIVRWAYNDLDAAAELAAKRADMADALASAERNRIGLMYALNPQVRDQAMSVAERAIVKADEQVKALEREGLRDSPDWDAAVRAKGIAESTLDDLNNGRFDVLQRATPDAEELASRVFKDLVRNNAALRTAIGANRATEAGIGGALTESTKGFAVNTRVGRAIESRRVKTATLTTEAQTTRGQMMGTGRMDARQVAMPGGRVATAAEKMERVSNPFAKSFWTADSYGNGFTRTVNVWRRATQENPAGFIITRGLGVESGYRELRAVFNQIRLYSGAARKIRLDDGSVVAVGGLERKRALLQQFSDAVGRSVDEGADAADALRRIENAIMSDMMAWYGVSRSNADELAKRAFRSRQQMMDGLTDERRGFWIDEQGQFNLIKDPWLESQLQSGTFMQNYRELERLLSMTEKSSMGRVLSEASFATGRVASSVFGLFNEIWRPLVLMRLGYTIRNNIEGQFRAAAFTGSLDPFSAAMVNVGYSAKSLFSKLAGYRNIDRAAAGARIQAAKAGGKPLPRKFEPWLKAQVNGGMRQANEYQAYISSHLGGLAEFSPEIRSWALDWYGKTIPRLQADAAQARSLGAVDEADSIDDVVRTMSQQEQQVRQVSTFQKFNRDAIRTFDELKFQDLRLDTVYRRLDELQDEPMALSMFFRQGASRSRAYSGTIEAPDSRTLYQAFNPDSPFTPPALSMLSSDATQRSILAGRVDATESFWRARRTTMYVKVNPGEPTYWDGVATALSQVRQSSIGARIMQGQTDDQIVQFLLRDRQGVETLRFLNGGLSKPMKGQPGVRVPDIREVEVQGRPVTIGYGVPPSEDVARYFVEQARYRYEKLTPNLDFRRFVETQPFGVSVGGKDKVLGYTGDELKRVFEQANGDPKSLIPVVGAQIEDFGLRDTMGFWRQATAVGMKWLGTIPEDTFTRQPFYGARYQATIKSLVETTMQQRGSVTLRDVERIQGMAHSRALKDTKDWLYTIDRPTVLGSIGENAVPFISAAQNSITTLGRLVYNDPNTAIMLATIWRAPNKAGMEDEEGNIVIPIPHDMIPDSIERALGLSAMRNIKINKSSLNVIIPESGFGFIPRPGPLVAVPVSEFMKRGWLGQQVESPDLLRTLFGKEGADGIWNVYKNYMFGEGQGVAPESMSLSMFAPPIAQRILQVVQLDSNQQFGYWYNAIYRSEMAKYAAGMRDKPTRDEVMNQTVGFTLLRLAANLTAVTPPQYQSIIDPMVQTVRYYEREFPNDSNRIINEKYGPILQMLGDFSNTQNNAGMLPTADSVERARKYSDIIAKAAPGLEERGDLSVLTMLTMGNANQLYDDSAYGWQFANMIPGVNRSFREYQKPAQSWVQSDVNAGWATYLRAEDQFKARLRQSGATTYRANPQLKAERDAYIADLRDNPFFENWYRDYKDFGSSRTRSSIYMMETLVNDERWMRDNGQSDIWQNAQLYLYHRNVVLEAVRQSGKGINADGNEQIRGYWDQARADLEANSTQWTSFSSRFLNGDDDPEVPGVSFM